LIGKALIKMIANQQEKTENCGAINEWEILIHGMG